MKKTKLGSLSILFPMPLVIVGAEVNDKPNFLTAAYCGIVEFKPAMIMVSLSKNHYTNEGIKSNKTFSVNIPSIDMAEATDYVGMFSGKKRDKSQVFDVFYGDLETAPMIKQAPLNLECKLVKTVDIEIIHEIFIGEITETYINDECLTEGVPDILKVNPIIYAPKMRKYLKIGDIIGDAWKIGKNFKPGHQ